MATNIEQQQPKTFNILELYSGIGGFHFAIKKLFAELGFDNYRITAVDINTSANQVYRWNHLNNNFKNLKSEKIRKNHVLLERNIQSFTVDDFDKMELDLLTMSPPCQPFSRLGLKRDLSDKRCCSFEHLMVNLIPNLHHKPRFIVLENVKGFETSEAHKLLIETLIKSGYRFQQQFLLTPFQFSVPNSRLRYYLIASLSPEPTLSLKLDNFHNMAYLQIPVMKSLNNIEYFDQIEIVSNNHDTLSTIKTEDCRGTYRDMDSIDTLLINVHLPYVLVKTVGEYLEEEDYDEQQQQKYCTRIDDSSLLRYHMLFDLVDRQSNKTNCFTKSYGHRIEGCGSILKSSITEDIDKIYSEVVKVQEVKDENGDESKKKMKIVELLRKLELRFFTPKEISNLMCFPAELEFPPNFNTKQQYRMLGNSVNVLVCYYLLRILIGPSLSRP